MTKYPLIKYGYKICWVMQNLHITNGIRFAAFGSSGSEKPQSGYALCGVFLCHIFTVAGMLRIPLSQP